MIGNSKVQKLISCETGASMVEFAIILPLFLLLIFGTIEISLLLYNKAMLTNAAREGARLGIVSKGGSSQRTPLDQIRLAVTNYCEKNMINLAEPSGLHVPIVQVSPPDPPKDYDPNTFAYGEYLVVTAEYDYTFLILPNIFNLINATGLTDVRSTLTISSVSRMRSE